MIRALLIEARYRIGLPHWSRIMLTSPLPVLVAHHAPSSIEPAATYRLMSSFDARFTHSMLVGLINSNLSTTSSNVGHKLHYVRDSNYLPLLIDKVILLTPSPLPAPPGWGAKFMLHAIVGHTHIRMQQIQCTLARYCTYLMLPTWRWHHITDMLHAEAFNRHTPPPKFTLWEVTGGYWA